MIYSVQPPGARGKWGSPASPMAVTEDEEENPVSARPKWGEGGNQNLAELPLEETASQMEGSYICLPFFNIYFGGGSV